MRRWPTSSWKQAAIAFAVALTSALCLCFRIEYGLFERYYFLRDTHGYWTAGLDRHSGLMDLCRVGGLILLGVFVTVFLLQRAFAANRHS